MIPKITTREKLQTALEGILGSRNVYFQPPESVKLKYPCIIYEFSSMETMKANNGKYIKHKKYIITAIDKDPESALPDKLIEIPYCRFDRAFVSDNLYHYTFNFFI